MAKSSEGTFPLLERADELVDELRLNIPRALKEWDKEAIHQARVATRRLKALLDLMELVLSPEHLKPVSRVLRKLRRRLGPLRDLDVMIDHLAELRTSKAQATAVEWLAARLEAQRTAARKQCIEARAVGRILSRLGSWWGLREEVGEAREAIDSLLAESLHLQIESFGARAAQLVQFLAARRAGSSIRVDPSDLHDPHELRIAGKRLRYTLEMAALQGHKLPSADMKSFKQMQESLGLWHDYVVLSERAMQVSLDALLPHHDAALQASLLDLAKVLLRRSARHLDVFSDTWAAQGRGLADHIRAQFPLTRSLNESQTGPDPSDSADTPIPVALAQDGSATI